MCQGCASIKDSSQYVLFKNNTMHTLCIECETTNNTIKIKQCSSCKSIKNIDQFYVNTTRIDGYRNQCIDCGSSYQKNNKDNIKIIQKQWYQKNKEKVSLQRKEYRKNNIDKINTYKENNKVSFQEYNKNYWKENKEELNIKQKIYYEQNKEQLNSSRRIENLSPLQIELKNNLSKQWSKNNRDKVNKSSLQWRNKKIKSDPSYKLRIYASNYIREALQSNGGSKNGYSILDFLPYSIEELKTHIENHFIDRQNLTTDEKVWMIWDNWGIYNPETWDDNDPSTWTWQLDHIKPHSTFHYITMDCQEFRDCWALSNLRPLRAKDNIIDGVSRIRHK